jgi:transporter family-2 protein
VNQTGKLPAIFAAVVGGSFMAVQARVNSGLGQEIGSGILAALVSFSIGLLIISVATFASSKNRAALSFTVAKFKDSSIPLWLSIAGMLGGIYVIMQGVVAGLIGVALFSIGVVTGSALSALLLDGNGLLGLTKRKIGLTRLAGTVLALSGLVVASDLANYSFSPLILLPFAAGIGIGFQQAMNGLFGKLAQSATVPTFFNFIAGTVFIALALLTVEGFSFPANWPTNPLLYLGGVVGVIFIFMQVVVLPKIGALSMGIAMLVGQLSGSVLLDLLVPIADRAVTISTLLGIVLAMLGAALVARR